MGGGLHGRQRPGQRRAGDDRPVRVPDRVLADHLRRHRREVPDAEHGQARPPHRAAHQGRAGRGARHRHVRRVAVELGADHAGLPQQDRGLDGQRDQGRLPAQPGAPVGRRPHGGRRLAQRPGLLAAPRLHRPDLGALAAPAPQVRLPAGPAAGRQGPRARPGGQPGRADAALQRQAVGGDGPPEVLRIRRGLTPELPQWPAEGRGRPRRMGAPPAEGRGRAGRPTDEEEG
ncbi:hypothetical protein SBRY_50415 [Actinacidiphila bryophytorum]|uniref:Uncharacterized protein n=1 Tax=Actinacidiphila bryophytorum TaxID=1436133 RepID=A0A9W4H4R2_9ACTN|nr:hypothetical protein SBRY_50415 [Actinacidiphila bryophytorum]